MTTANAAPAQSSVRPSGPRIQQPPCDCLPRPQHAPPHHPRCIGIAVQVQAIADQFVSVRRCEAAGEILCGGNIFVDVSYTDALVAPVKAAIVALLGPAADDEIVSLLGDFRAAKVSRRDEPVPPVVMHTDVSCANILVAGGAVVAAYGMDSLAWIDELRCLGSAAVHFTYTGEAGSAAPPLATCYAQAERRLSGPNVHVLD